MCCMIGQDRESITVEQQGHKMPVDDGLRSKSPPTSSRDRDERRRRSRSRDRKKVVDGKDRYEV